MERYSGTQATEGMPVDPGAEWASTGGETGLEERMWQLGLGAGPEAYPLRPDEPDCIYFMRTGFCGYGNRCRFNHPRDRNSVMGSLRTSVSEYPERTGQPYYMRTGMCQFGSTCKYHHPNYGVGSSAPITLNFYGYPSRPGEKECSHYMKTGQCRFGITCKFHHPQPTGIQLPIHGPGLAAPPGGPTAAVYPTVQTPSLQTSPQYGMISGNWLVDRPDIIPGSYVHGSYGPIVLPPGVIPVPGWPPYPAPVNPDVSQSTQPTVGAGPMYGITQLSPSSASYTGPYAPVTSSIGQSSSSRKEHEFPERPGEPECQYYLRTGDCKFGCTCKYHHPRELIAPTVHFQLSPLGLPLHPGMSICSHYAQSRMCKYGSSCRFDHPIGTMSYSPSASSLTDMPVAPYPVGSTTATLAPLSSSLDLRPENLSGPNRDSGPSRMSNANSSSTSVGPITSEGGSTPQCGARHSRPGSASSR